MKNKHVIGCDSFVDFYGDAQHVPAKVDTGAASSAVWASNIRIDSDDKLRFVLFDPSSEYYTGKEYCTEEYSAVYVMDGGGHVGIRYKTEFSVDIEGIKLRTNFTLSERSRHKYPILIGKRALRGHFLVDVEIPPNITQHPKLNQPGINKELREDPQAFHKKYHSNEESL